MLAVLVPKFEAHRAAAFDEGPRNPAMIWARPARRCEGCSWAKPVMKLGG